MCGNPDHVIQSPRPTKYRLCVQRVRHVFIDLAYKEHAQGVTPLLWIGSTTEKKPRSPGPLLILEYQPAQTNTGCANYATRADLKNHDHMTSKPESYKLDLTQGVTPWIAGLQLCREPAPTSRDMQRTLVAASC